MSGDEREVQETTTVRRSGDEWAERKLAVQANNGTEAQMREGSGMPQSVTSRRRMMRVTHQGV
jgi:hypothetical protein